MLPMKLPVIFTSPWAVATASCGASCRWFCHFSHRLVSFHVFLAVTLALHQNGRPKGSGLLHCRHSRRYALQGPARTSSPSRRGPLGLGSPSSACQSLSASPAPPPTLSLGLPIPAGGCEARVSSNRCHWSKCWSARARKEKKQTRDAGHDPGLARGCALRTAAGCNSALRASRISWLSCDSTASCSSN